MKNNSSVDILTGEVLFGQTDQFLVFRLAVSKEITRHYFLDLLLPDYHRSGSKKIRMRNSDRSHRCYINAGRYLTSSVPSTQSSLMEIEEYSPMTSER
jgi:hypothetical protein